MMLKNLTTNIKYNEIDFAPFYDEEDLSKPMTLEEFEAEFKEIN